MSYDVLIQGGLVCSGDLAPASRTDVALKDGIVAAVGQLSREAAVVVDAADHVVAPGFIDIHSHSDYTLMADPRALSAIHQGVTLEVVGNCGFGCAPLRDPRAAREGIYGFEGSVPIAWRDFGGYFAALEARRPAVNVMSLAPNGQIRRAVLADVERPSGPDESAALAAALHRCLDEGCHGFSTGLEYPVERAATEAELGLLVREVAGRGGLYATHTRHRSQGALPAIEEAIRTAAAARARLQISHLIPRSTEDGEIERSLDLVAEARARDVDVTFDMHTRAFGTTMLNTLLPPWATRGSHQDRIRLLGDAAARDRMRDFPSIITSVGDWSRVVLLDMAPWPEFGRQSLAEIAEKRGQHPLDAAYDLLMREPEDGPPFMVILLCYSEDQQAAFFSHPDCIPASDATTLGPDGPLARAEFHGAYTWAAWFYRFMVRDRGILTVEEAVHRMTGRPADVLRLKRRGRLKPGMAADLCVFDPQTFRERGTVFEPSTLAVGMRDVFVNGTAVLRDGVPTGERRGMVIRDLAE